MDKALTTIPDALAVLKDQRNKLADALDAARQVQRPGHRLGQPDQGSPRSGAAKTSARCWNRWPTPGPALTRALSFLPTFPFPKEHITNWLRGDYANLTLIIDLTLSRIDAGLFTGTRWECDLTELELQWGRTIGQLPSPCTASGPGTPGNPLLVPYRWDQGP